MSDFKITNGKLLQYIGYDNVVEIPNGVTSIEDQAFYGCSGLTSITIPNSVTSIGERAFYGCTRLTSIIIPNSVTSIGRGAFAICTRLTSITIPNSVTSIGPAAFLRCTRLTSVIIPNSVTSIEEEAFYECKKLTSIKIPNSVTWIGENAFSGCKRLTNIEMSDSAIYRVFKNIKQICNNIFLGCHKHKPIENSLIAYKGFNSNMTCRDFQYEEGKTYTCDNAKLCECGFHACLNPIDVFNYYWKNSVYHEVIIEDVCNEKGEDSKICGKKITIGRRLTIKEMFDIFYNLNKD